MKLHYQLTLDELTEAGLQALVQGPQWKPHIRRVIKLGWLIYFLAALFIWLWTQSIGLASVVFVFGFLITPLVLGNKRLRMRTFRRQFKKAYQLKGNERFLEASTLEFNEKKVLSKNKISEGSFQWAAFQDLIETPDLYVLTMGSSILPFPKRAFKTKAEGKATIKWIQKHLKQKS